MNLNECENVAKMSRISITLERKMDIIRRMEDGWTRPNVCTCMKLPHSTVSVVLKNANKLEQSMRHAT